MTATEVIQRLQVLIERYGDKEVYINDSDYGPEEIDDIGVVAMVDGIVIS